MQHTGLRGPVPALLAESYVGAPPLQGFKSPCRHLSGGQARKKASKALQHTGAADVQASQQPSPSMMQAAGILEKGADEQQGLVDASGRLSSSALLRRLTAVSSANEALDIFLQDGAARQSPGALQGFTEARLHTLQDSHTGWLTHC